MKGKSWRILKDLVMIFVASLIYGAGISLFLDPNNLAPGGVSGVAVILNRLSGIDTGTLYLLINIPIILVGIWKFGLRFMGKTMYAVILTSWATNILTPYGPMTTDPLLAALTGSVLLALGIGMVFKAGATTGGVDIIVKLLRKRYRHLKTGFLFECTDLLIVACSGLVFRNINTILYALIAVLVSGAALDYVLYGGDEAKMIYIITEKPEEIGRRIMKELDVGITYLRGSGGWTGNEKQVILCVVRRVQGPQVEELVKTEDPAAFMIVTSASEIYGEGYKDFFAEKL